jgi:MFS transporter, putative metabolite:H+ symporter
VNQYRVVEPTTPSVVARPTGVAALSATSGFALTLVLLGWVFAGMDYTIYSYALPLILTDLNISIPTAGLIFFLSLQGTFIGSLLAGVLADALGRRRVMMGNILLYALSTGTVALAQSAGFLTVVRFLVNFGVGAEQPVGATYISEVWNPKTRGRAMGFMQSGYAIGTLLATLLLALIAERFGWRLLFIIGAIPALLVVGFRMWLPESRRWEDQQREKANRAAAGQKTGGFPMRELFGRDLLRVTTIGTVLLIMGNTAGGGIQAWAPTYLKVQHGLDISTVGWLGVVQALGLLLGYVGAGWVADALSRRYSLMIFFALGVVSLIIFGLVSGLALLGVAFFVVGVSIGGQFGNFVVYLSELFPTHARATGVGWCMGIGLFFWALVPLVLSALAPTGNFGTLFAIFGGAACVLGIVTAYLGPETKGLELA